jgi:hypothetical protein
MEESSIRRISFPGLVAKGYTVILWRIFGILTTISKRRFDPNGAPRRRLLSLDLSTPSSVIAEFGH